ncbi:MAG: ABC transporter permease [Ruminococcaceae bacterium]|nr:ABC transporter permease [Oscillospiraceae bacterium]
MNNKTPLLRRDGTVKLLSSLLSIVIGLVVGGLIVLLVGAGNKSIGITGAWEGLRLIFAGILSTGRDAAGSLTWGFNPANVGNMLFRAVPVIMTGLSVAVAFKTGLFNIGAPGQYLMSTMVTLIIALSIPTTAVPAGLVWLLAFVGGMVAGALWGAIPGIVKAFLNINEVLACIMTNWIAANLVTWVFDGSVYRNVVENTKTGYIYSTAYGLTEVDGVWTYVKGNGVQTAKMGLDKIFPGSQVNGGIIIAILLAVLVWVLMSKTTLGYQLKACGSNRHAARYAGINDKRNIVLSMAIAGSMAGAAASLYYLSGNTEFYWNTYQSLPAVGFNGIPVALLAMSNPIGVIFSGVFMAMLDIVGLQLTNLTAYNEFITDVIIAVIVYLSAFSLVIRTLLTARKKSRDDGPNANADSEPAAAEAMPAADAADATPADAANSEQGGEQA